MMMTSIETEIFNYKDMILYIKSGKNVEGVSYLYFKGRIVVNKEVILDLVLKQVNLFLLNCVTVTQKNVILNAV